MVTIEEVIEYFEQDEYPPESFWRFKEPKEAAAVVRAQHEEIERLRAALQDAADVLWLNHLNSAARKAERALKTGEPK